MNYPNQSWYRGDWIKNLILSFDGVGLLVPDYMRDGLDRFDPSLVEGLSSDGLLHVLEPETVVDKGAAEKLAEAMAEAISSGALDDLTGQKTAFAELSMSRLGFLGDAGLAGMIVEELKARGSRGTQRTGCRFPCIPRSVRWCSCCWRRSCGPTGAGWDWIFRQ